MTGEKYGKAIKIAELPDSIRGYEHVKEKAAIAAKKRGQELVEALRF